MYLIGARKTVGSDSRALCLDFVILTIMPVIMLAFCLPLRAADAGQPQTLQAKVDALFADAVHGDSPGAAVLVARDGATIFEKGYGFAQVETQVPINRDTRFRIGSVTKQFTAAAILKLAEQGKLSINDPLSKYIADWPRGQEVTLRHLLTHSSGIHNFTAKSDFQARVRAPISLEKLLASFKNDPYDFDPGNKFSYCNSGYVLLGFIIEKVTGQTYESYLKKTFFDPLGMKDTGVYTSGAHFTKEALGYSYQDGAVKRAIDWDMSNVATAGELYSTAHDLFLWNEALFNQKVLSAASMRAAFTVAVLNGDDPAHPEDTGYGFGWTIDRLRGAREISHGGELAGFGSYLLRLPDYHLTVVVLLNCVPQLPKLQQWALARQIACVALDSELPPELPPRIMANVPPAALHSIIGRYDMGSGMLMKVTTETNHVFAEISGRNRFEIFPKTDRDFFIGSGEASATFIKDTNNQVIKAILKQGGDRIDAPKLKE